MNYVAVMPQSGALPTNNRIHKTKIQKTAGHCQLSDNMCFTEKKIFEQAGTLSSLKYSIPNCLHDSTEQCFPKSGNSITVFSRFINVKRSEFSCYSSVD